LLTAGRSGRSICSVSNVCICAGNEESAHGEDDTCVGVVETSGLFLFIFVFLFL